VDLPALTIAWFASVAEFTSYVGAVGEPQRDCLWMPNRPGCEAAGSGTVLVLKDLEKKNGSIKFVN